MSQFNRLILWPALAGLLIAILILYAFPELVRNHETEIPLTQTPAPDATEGAPLAAQPQDRRLFGPVSYAAAVQQAAPAVVSVYTMKTVTAPLPRICTDPLWRRYIYCNPRQRTQAGLGSGVVTGPQGYILTNNHVIESADEIRVALADGRQAVAEVVGTDKDTDLAVLKITLDNLPTIRIANDQDALQVGDVVLAIGNPFGFGQTVTMGIISATGRSQLRLTAYDDFIQTDAAINPGNSGGALINAMGEMIGINTAIFSKSGGSEGIGFAIPADLANTVMQEIIQYGSVERGWLGVQVEEITPPLAEYLGLKQTRGVVITDLDAGGPAETAGLRIGDVILQVDEVPVQSGRQAMNQIADFKPGQQITLYFIRESAQMQTKVLIAKRPITGV